MRFVEGIENVVRARSKLRRRNLPAEPPPLSRAQSPDVANVCDIEKGRKGVSPEKAEQIAKAIGVPPALLVRLSIEESLRAAGLKYIVEVKPAGQLARVSPRAARSTRR